MRRSPDVIRVLVARSLRAFGDGCVAILLPVHLSRLGYDAFGVGLISTASLLGSALLMEKLCETARNLRALSWESALADLVDTKIAQLELFCLRWNRSR